MLLEQLIEKKDLLAYCKFKREVLSKQMYDAIDVALPKNKETTKQYFVGKMNELLELSDICAGNKIKEKSKKYLRDLKKGDK